MSANGWKQCAIGIMFECLQWPVSPFIFNMNLEWSLEATDDVSSKSNFLIAISTILFLWCCSSNARAVWSKQIWKIWLTQWLYFPVNRWNEFIVRLISKVPIVINTFSISLNFLIRGIGKNYNDVFSLYSDVKEWNEKWNGDRIGRSGLSQFANRWNMGS